MTLKIIWEAKHHCTMGGDTKQEKQGKRELKLPDTTNEIKAFKAFSVHSGLGK